MLNLLEVSRVVIVLCDRLWCIGWLSRLVNSLYLIVVEIIIWLRLMEVLVFLMLIVV